MNSFSVTYNVRPSTAEGAVACRKIMHVCVTTAEILEALLHE